VGDVSFQYGRTVPPASLSSVVGITDSQNDGAHMKVFFDTMVYSRATGIASTSWTCSGKCMGGTGC
jgi:hypothetical protein